MDASRDHRLLALWERGLGLERWRREDALLATGGEPAIEALDARNVALLRLRNTLFDRAWPLGSRCPACGEGCTFEVDGVALETALGCSAEAPAQLSWAGQEIVVRPPTVADLRAAASSANADVAARVLLGRCAAIDTDGLNDAEVAALGDALEALFPASAVGFALSCPACGHGWSAGVDVGVALWAEVHRAAESLLLDVDALARAYGWSEAAVLDLPPARRAAYLQMVAG